MRNRLISLAWFLPVIIVALLLGPENARSQTTDDSTAAHLRDTIYILDSTYLEVNIEHQEIYQHYRSGAIDTFLCSTGNPDIPDGIATRPGIFTIRLKERKHFSTAFQVMMLNWMPFDDGIGFHALEGNGYYNFLGYQTSSHGCVRISRETAEDLFITVPVGTAVFVHRGNALRIPMFGVVEETRRITSRDRGLLRRRLAAVAAGRADDPSLRRKLAIPAGGKLKMRIDVE